jgi:hypothetical protein
MAPVRDMPDAPRNKMSLCSGHNLEEKLTFCPQKDQYRPVLEGKIRDSSSHIKWLPWIDIIRHPTFHTHPPPEI